MDTFCHWPCTRREVAIPHSRRELLPYGPRLFASQYIQRIVDLPYRWVTNGSCHWRAISKSVRGCRYYLSSSLARRMRAFLCASTVMSHGMFQDLSFKDQVLERDKRCVITGKSVEGNDPSGFTVVHIIPPSFHSYVCSHF